MAEVLLTHAVNEAEEAIESGNYGNAIATCQRILGQFPEFAGAHRIMADAYAEQGDLESARQAYQRTLERDPQSIPAHLGLGMMAEDAGDLETALAYFQVAWEIDPRRRDLREHVSRVSQQIYGSDGRLYLTRAALASLHFHAGRWDRAVSEAAQVLQEFSTRIDVQVRLAEALWRRGDDVQARQVCQTVLRSLPSAVVPLLVLADIHRHEGDEATANELLKQARDIDPDGVRAADLIMIGLDDQADFLAVDSIPTIDDQVVHEEPARYAPAPDFMMSEPEAAATPHEPAQDDIQLTPPVAADVPVDPSMDETGVQPFRWEDIGDEDLEISDLQEPTPEQVAEAGSPPEFSLPTDEEIERARPSDERAAGFTGMLASLESEGMQPFDPGGGPPAAPEVEATTEVSMDDQVMPSDEDIEQARPTGPTPRGHTEMLDSLESEGMQPFDPFGEGDRAEPGTESEIDESPDEDSLHLSMTTDEDLERARPADETPRGFTSMLSSLDSEGVEPFDPTGEPQSEESPAVEEEQPDAASAEAPFDLDWSSIDDEIEEAIPGELPSGYTDELRDLDDVGLEPFSFSESDRSDEDVPAREDELDVQPEAAVDDPGSSDDEMDLDSLTADWDQEASVPGESLDDALDDAFDSIDAVFEGEADESFAETEQLRPESIEWSDVEEVAPEHPTPDQGIDRLMAESGGVWPVSAETPAADDQALFEETITEIEQLATEQADQPLDESPKPGTGSFSAERLGLDEALIERARSTKQRLVAEGLITGSVPWPGEEPVEEIESLESLRQATEENPLDVDSRVALASALVKEHPDEALEQFRWIYRNAPDRGPDVMNDLVRLMAVMREREVSVHRLLGALYRRHGDWMAAANHYEESLIGKRPRRAGRSGDGG
jgi:tetratricopeptide (TPR) repeat protein